MDQTAHFCQLSNPRWSNSHSERLFVMLNVFLNVIRPVRWLSFISKIKLSTSWKMSGLLPLLELSKDSRCPVFQARAHADGDGHDHHHYQVWTHTWHKVTIDTWFGGGGGGSGHTELTWVDKSRPPPTPVYQLYSVFWKEKKMADFYGGCSLPYRLLRLMAGV